MEMYRKSVIEILTLIVFLLVIWLLFLLGTDVNANPYIVEMEIEDTIAGKEVLSYLAEFHSKVSSSRFERAKRYAPYAIHWSDYYGLDCLLTSVVISAESGWTENPLCQFQNKTKCGRGLMQVKGVAARGFDLNDPSQQIKAGSKWLRRSIDRCHGSVIRGLMAYQTRGRCSGKLISGAKKRYRLYKKAIKNHRKTDLVS